MDPWFSGNPKWDGSEIPDDADLILITNGHYNHFSGVIDLFKNSVRKSKDTKIACNYEIGSYLKEKLKSTDVGAETQDINEKNLKNATKPEEHLILLNKGGSTEISLSLGGLKKLEHVLRIYMTRALHSSSIYDEK